MRPRSFSSLLGAAVLAGAIAGLALGAFHFFFTERLIQAAIDLEQAMPGHEGEVEVVSREMQRVGLVVGFLIYGLAAGVLFTCALFLLQRVLPGMTLARKAAALAITAYWCFALGPFLKYPANPPGVGEPDTIEYRQSIALTYAALLVIAAAISLFAYWKGTAEPRNSGVLRRIDSRSAVLLLIGANAVVGVLLALVLPANPDPVEVPADLLQEFRAMSLAGLTLFWALFAGLLAWRLRLPRSGTPVSRTGLAPGSAS